MSDDYEQRTDALIGTKWRRKRDGEVVTIRSVTKVSTNYGRMPSWGWVHWTNGHGKAGDIHLDNLPRMYEQEKGGYPEWAK